MTAFPAAIVAFLAAAAAFFASLTAFALAAAFLAGEIDLDFESLLYSAYAFLARLAYFFALIAAFFAFNEAALTALANFLAIAAFLAESFAAFLAESLAFLEATDAALAALAADFSSEIYFFFAASIYSCVAFFDFESLSY